MHISVVQRIAPFCQEKGFWNTWVCTRVRQLAEFNHMSILLIGGTVWLMHGRHLDWIRFHNCRASSIFASLLSQHMDDGHETNNPKTFQWYYHTTYPWDESQRCVFFYHRWQHCPVGRNFTNNSFRLEVWRKTHLLDSWSKACACLTKLRPFTIKLSPCKRVISIWTRGLLHTKLNTPYCMP